MSSARSPVADRSARRPSPAAAPVSGIHGGRGGVAARKAGKALLPIAAGVLLVAVWEAGLIHRVLGLQPYVLAYPSTMLEALRDNSDAFIRHTRNTMWAAAIGYTIGSAGGYALALAFSQFAAIRRMALPVVSGLMSMPVIAVAPLTILYFGTTVAAKAAVVTLMTLPPMAVMAHKGLVSVDADSRDLLHTYAATRRDGLVRLACPAGLPYVFTALKLNVTLSLVGAIISEFVSARLGIGMYMKRALGQFDMPRAWAAMAVVGLVGVLWYQIVALVERFVVPWHESVRGDEEA